MNQTRINPLRPLEELTGENRGIVRMRLGNVHLSNTLLHAARQARPPNMRSYPVALRRGWAKCVIDTWGEYRNTWVAVLTGNLGGGE